MDFLSLMPDWLVTHGPAFVIVLPLMAAAIAAILPNRQSAFGLTFIVIGLCLFTSIGLAITQVDVGSMLYKMGGWAPPYGISLVVDALSAPLLVLISFMALVTLFYALPATLAEVEPKKRAPYYGAFMLCVAGLLGMVITGDAFNVFVFLEVSSIATYVLVALGANRDRRALAAAYNYLILGSIGATFFVIGIGFLYMETGTLNMADMGRILRDMDGGSRVSQVAFGFIFIGLGLKLAMFPLHTWLPGAYAYAPTQITVFLASTATKAALYLLIRFAFTVFDPDFAYVGATLFYLVVALGVIGMLAASMMAIFQTDARRVLAFSSVAQVGYMLLGIGIATSAAIAAGYLHLLNHAIIKGGLFLALGAMWYRFGITRTVSFAGLGKTMPWTMGAFTILGLSLIGVPFTAGFVSKVRLAEAAAEQGWWWAVAVIVVTSVLAIFYMGRLMLNAYFQDPPVMEDGEVCERNEAPLLMLLPMWGMAACSVAIGIKSDLVYNAAARAAALVMGGGS